VQQESSRKSTRRPRSDGERNRARLIAAAKRAFAEKGAAVGLEHIARQADVSIATLYRLYFAKTSSDSLVTTRHPRCGREADRDGTTGIF
jgi:methylphosphotriester-DNA--protein-cysteine methyltransferase